MKILVFPGAEHRTNCIESQRAPPVPSVNPSASFLWIGESVARWLVWCEWHNGTRSLLCVRWHRSPPNTKIKTVIMMMIIIIRQAQCVAGLFSCYCCSMIQWQWWCFWRKRYVPINMCDLYICTSLVRDIFYDLPQSSDSNDYASRKSRMRKIRSTNHDLDLIRNEQNMWEQVRFRRN